MNIIDIWTFVILFRRKRYIVRKLKSNSEKKNIEDKTENTEVLCKNKISNSLVLLIVEKKFEKKKEKK